ncbi:Ca-activated chloride channel family protein [Hydrogenophaga palleronii]|uniref:Ca-activated chloride channel family protein n=1 Tax=Hydrogenophaga palleronii TaxID=65655 RepID=A0ABU1WPQ6_9BURK|nr:VWA domain-containing protein [Hydrogenophaga palleronii]MDR7151263.1 Ca-activated chloride channel family protein [Hydrogenophaga palleronii]
MNNLPVTFIWPQFLWLLLALPLLVLIYWWLLRRRRHAALRYASLAIVREAMGKGPGWRRHVPPLLLLLAFAAMLLASARPMASIVLPSQEQTIILAMDVSGSMRAEDVQPNRLVASQNAAKAFLAELPRHVKVGIVAFAGTAQVVQPVTLSREDLVAAIDKFQLQRATAIGSAIVVSLSELFPEQRINLGDMTYSRNSDPFAPKGRSLDQPKSDEAPFTPVAPGSYTSAAVILLTDGQRTTGVETAEATQMAADRGVRVYTVGVGTVDGEIIGFEGWSMRVRLDEETLKDVAEKTKGEYFYAGTAENLKQVYESLSTRLTVEKKETEIAGLLALLASVLVMVSAGLSLLWFNRVA